MSAEIAKELIKGYECKHAVYRADRERKNDIIFIKENIHLLDGTIVPNTRIIKNYKRPFWVTKTGYRNHEQKKTYEFINKTQKFESTQTRLAESISKALGRPSFNNNVKMVCRSPFVYGADVTTPVLIKKAYKTKWADCISMNSVAVLDIETDVVNGTEEIISIALTYKNKAILTATKEFIGTIPNPETAIKTCVDKYLGEHIKNRNIELEIYIGTSPADLVDIVMQKAHAWKPDFINIWNMNYDIPRMIAALEKEGYDVGAVFSDPSVPREYASAKYKEGNAQKVTASGKVTAPHPADLWHTMDCLSSFYFIDGMCVYKKIRAAKGNEASYSLEYILNKWLKIGKLKFEEAKFAEGTLRWHEIMQANHKLEYLAYNLFDCISVELLDEKNKDISNSLSVLCDVSEYSRFPSQPRRTCDNMHFFLLDRDKVIATTSDDMKEELDADVVDMTDWIITLPSYLVDDNGLRALQELPEVRSEIRLETNDLDCTSSYPFGQIALNISKETTVCELSRIKDIDETVWRKVGINLSGGKTNAMEICNVVFKYPDPRTMLKQFKSDIGMQ